MIGLGWLVYMIGQCSQVAWNDLKIRRKPVNFIYELTTSGATGDQHFANMMTYIIYILISEKIWTQSISLSSKRPCWNDGDCCCSCTEVCHQPLHWRHNERDGVSNHRRPDCLLNYWSKKTSKIRVINHYIDVIMSAMESQITGVPIVCSTIDQRKHQRSVSLAFLRGIWIRATKVQ